MSSLINRLFNKILAKRIENNIVLDPRQKAFFRRYGIAENLTPRFLNICLINVSKTLSQFLTILLFILLI